MIGAPVALASAGVLAQSSSGQDLTGLAGVVQDLINAIGPIGVALMVLVESVFPPIPSEVVLPAAGFVASINGDSPVIYIIAATVGSIAGSWVLYGMGRGLGDRRTKKILCALPLVSESDFDKAEQWFIRYDRWAVLFGRCIPLVRSLISLPAGVAAMPLSLFTLYTAVGSLIWNTLLIMAGYYLGERWELVSQYVGAIGNIVLIVCIVLAIWYIVTRLQRLRRERREQGK